MCSTIWHKICAIGPVVAYQFQWSVGIGAAIHIFTNPWISNILLSACPAFVNMDRLPLDVQMVDLITPDHAWNHFLLNDLFLANTMIHLNAIPLPQGQ